MEQPNLALDAARQAATQLISATYFKLFKSRTSFYSKRDREDDKKQFERLCASLAPGISYFTDGSSKTNPGPAGAGIYQPAYNSIPILFKSTSLGNIYILTSTICTCGLLTQSTY